MLVIYMLFMAILILQGNSLIAAKENIWPAIVIVWPSTENNFVTPIPPKLLFYTKHGNPIAYANDKVSYGYVTQFSSVRNEGNLWRHFWQQEHTTGQRLSIQ